MKVLIIIPTYNEKEDIEKLVETIISLNREFHILIIDDNSPDGTGEIARELSDKYSEVSTIHRPHKLGLGTAYIEGFKYALKNNYDYIFTMDADFSHNPKYLPLFLEKLRNYQLVIGSRYIEGGGVVNWPLWRKMLSRFGSFYTRIITNIGVRDCTSGYIAYRREVLENIDLESINSRGYAFTIELKYKCTEKGFMVGEIPIIFADRSKGKSKISKSIIFEAAFLVLKLKKIHIFRKGDCHPERRDKNI